MVLANGERGFVRIRGPIVEDLENKNGEIRVSDKGNWGFKRSKKN